MDDPVRLRAPRNASSGQGSAAEKHRQRRQYPDSAATASPAQAGPPLLGPDLLAGLRARLGCGQPAGLQHGGRGSLTEARSGDRLTGGARSQEFVEGLCPPVSGPEPAGQRGAWLPWAAYPGPGPWRALPFKASDNSCVCAILS